MTMSENGCNVGECDATNNDKDGGNYRLRFNRGRLDWNSMPSCRNNGMRRTQLHYHCKTLPVFWSTFFEHVGVLLK